MGTEFDLIIKHGDIHRNISWYIFVITRETYGKMLEEA